MVFLDSCLGTSTEHEQHVFGQPFEGFAEKYWVGCAMSYEAIEFCMDF